ncbi:MAG: polysaccharide biosynthesis protein [Gammaproteobacteria bacterium SHHR-1]
MPLQRFTQSVLAMPRMGKRLFALLVDVSLIVLSVWLAFYLRLDTWLPLRGDSYWRPELALSVALLIALPIFITRGFYRAIFRYSGWPALITVAWGVVVYGLIYMAVFTAIGVEGVPRTIGVLQPMLLLLAIGGSRILARFWLGGLYQNQLRQASRPRVLIYGAGLSGRQLATALNNSHEMRVVGFLDDDPQLQGHVLNALPIHAPEQLPELIERQGVSDLLLALPSVGRHRRNQILARIRHLPLAVRTLPSVTELVQGRVSVSDLRELDADDLLGREPVAPDPELLNWNVRDKVVMVTGAGGSIGAELCRQILKLGPQRLLLVEQSEFALYQIHQALLRTHPDQEARLLPLLASVCDLGRMRQILNSWRPDTLYHAAAYKHVPLVEHNPVEGVENNVLGTWRTAQAAMEAAVADFVLISTDKAVRPSNVMGASKRLAELVLQALSQQDSATRFCMVRFGNVLGSSGSVVPRFREQIRQGGPITLTHPDITRYFMTIPEAAQLVIQAGAMGQGGDVFVLDMGEPVRILELAQRMVELSGLMLKDDINPEGDIEIQITGLRPGEKLFEELLIGNDPQPTAHPRILRAREDSLPWDQLESGLQQLQQALKANNAAATRALLLSLVSGYRPSGGIVDWVCMQTGPVTAEARTGAQKGAGLENEA